MFIFGAYSLAGFKLEILQRAYKKRKNDKLTLSQEHFSNRKNLKVGDFCSQKQLQDYLSAEPVMKSLKMKLRQIAHQFLEYLATLFCCCLNRRHIHRLSNKLNDLAEDDREVNKGLRTIQEHLDVESIIKLNQRVRALERLTLDEDESKFQKQKKILRFNRFNYLTSGSEKHHLLENDVKKSKFQLLYKTKVDVQ